MLQRIKVNPLKSHPHAHSLFLPKAMMHFKIHTHTQIYISGRNTLSTALAVTSFEHTLKKFVKIRAKHDLKKKKYWKEFKHALKLLAVKNVLNC